MKQKIKITKRINKKEVVVARFLFHHDAYDFLTNQKNVFGLDYMDRIKVYFDGLDTTKATFDYLFNNKGEQ